MHGATIKISLKWFSPIQNIIRIVFWNSIWNLTIHQK